MRRATAVRVAALFTAVLCGLTIWSAPAQASGLHLHRGSHGHRVRVLETRLARLHLLRRSFVDGRYTLATVRAVRRFQRAHHLRVTGRTNLATWEAVTRAVARNAVTRPVPAPTPLPVPLILGHRGARIAGLAENSLASMAYAHDKADILEFDLRETADHHFIVMHDGSLDRTTDCTGDVDTRTLADIESNCQLDADPYGTPLSAEQPIPTFAQVVDYASSVDMPIAPELKSSTTPLSDDALQEFQAVIDSHGYQHKTYVQSFAAADFPRVHAVEPSVSFVYLSEASPAAVRAAGAAIVGPVLGRLTAARVAAYHRAGLKVWPYTAMTTADLRHAQQLRVDAVFTDLPAEARALYH